MESIYHTCDIHASHQDWVITGSIEPSDAGQTQPPLYPVLTPSARDDGQGRFDGLSEHPC